MQLFCDISDYPVAFLLIMCQIGKVTREVKCYCITCYQSLRFFGALFYLEGAAYLPHGLRSSYLTLFLVSIVNIQQSNAGVSRRVVMGDTRPPSHQSPHLGLPGSLQGLFPESPRCRLPEINQVALISSNVMYQHHSPTRIDTEGGG